mgnify:CR=1 FL=1
MSNGLDLALLNWGNYDLIVIDESHNFRNGGKVTTDEDDENPRENRYLRLMNKVIRAGVRTKVLMLSATPVNNRFNDLKNQLQLAYEGDQNLINDKLDVDRPIEEIFRTAQTQYNTWAKLSAPKERTTEHLLDMLSFDFFQVLDAVTIARSRKHIEKYYDTADIGKFPTRLTPISKRPHLTDLDEAITYKDISEQLDALNLGVYAPSDYILASRRYKYEIEKDGKGTHLGMSGREKGLKKLMAINLLKRLESSVNSFRLTVIRIKEQIDDTLNAINTYMKCPLKFYFTYVAGLRPEEDVSEDVDKPMFGILFHDAMRKLYAPHVGKPLASATLKDLAENTTLITQKLNNAFAVNLFKKPEKDELGNDIDYGTDTAHRLVLNGTQLINRHVIRDFIVHQITADMKMAKQLESEGGYLQIISQEEKYTTHFPLRQGASEGVALGGYIDRLDLLHSPQGDRIRIVDYKTSNHQQTANTVTDLFDLDKCTRNYHIMQTLYCAKVITSAGSEYADMAVCPSLMYCAKDSGNNYSGIIKLETWERCPNRKPKKEEMTDFKAQYGTEFDALLTEKIEEIFTPYQGEDSKNLGQRSQELFQKENSGHGVFTQCKDEQNCQYCDFLSFCRRSPKKNY